MTTEQLLAAATPDASTVGTGVGFLVVTLCLFVACYFLFRSLTKQLNRIDFPEDVPVGEPVGQSADRKNIP